MADNLQQLVAQIIYSWKSGNDYGVFKYVWERISGLSSLTVLLLAIDTKWSKATLINKVEKQKTIRKCNVNMTGQPIAIAFLRW